MIRIKELRLEKKMTQAELAKILGVNQTAVGKYERGDLQPNNNILCMLADIFDVSVDYLLGLEDDLGVKKYSSEHNRAALSEDESELLKNFRKLGPFARSAILIQVKALSEEDETVK